MRLERKRIHLVLRNSMLLFGFLTAVQLSAQETPELRALTLEQAVDLAFEQNPAFRTSLDNAQAARSRLKQAQATRFPEVGFRQDFTRGNDPVYVFGTQLRQRQFTTEDFALNQLNAPLPTDNFQTRLDAQWRLFDSGQTLFQRRSAKKLVTAADYQTEQTRQDLILDVVRSYDAVLALRENLRAADQAVRTAEASVQRMETMQQAGMIVDSDLLSAKVFLA